MNCSLAEATRLIADCSICSACAFMTSSPDSCFRLCLFCCGLLPVAYCLLSPLPFLLWPVACCLLPAFAFAFSAVACCLLPIACSIQSRSAAAASCTLASHTQPGHLPPPKHERRMARDDNRSPCAHSRHVCAATVRCRLLVAGTAPASSRGTLPGEQRRKWPVPIRGWRVSRKWTAGLLAAAPPRSRPIAGPLRSGRSHKALAAPAMCVLPFS